MTNNAVYITRAAAFLPNDGVSNDDIELYLGYINNQPSVNKALVLQSNGIKKRYYALTKSQQFTHNNAQMASLAVRNLFLENPSELTNIELLSCGTSCADQIAPSHAVMVHGNLPETSNIEVTSHAGICCSSMHALKYAYMSIYSGQKQIAVTTGSERASAMMLNNKFDSEANYLNELQRDPYVAFEKDFLRWMLSDGAGAFLLENKKNANSISLKIDWIESCSFANELEACMYAGADKMANGQLKGMFEFSLDEISNHSVLAFKQDVNLLNRYVVELWVKFMLSTLEKHNKTINDIDYFLPHISSFFMKPPLIKAMRKYGLDIDDDKWFTNLATVGNVGSAAAYLMVEEIMNSGKLKDGDNLLLVVPESGRFSFSIMSMTVCL